MTPPPDLFLSEIVEPDRFAGRSALFELDAPDVNSGEGEDPSDSKDKCSLLEVAEDAATPSCGNDDHNGDASLALEEDVSPSRRRRTLRAIVAFIFLSLMGLSLWIKSCLAIYLDLISDGDPVAVGWLTSLMGLSQLLSSLAAGCAADRPSPGRLRVLRFAVGWGAASFAYTAWAAQSARVPAVAVALVLWGAYWGIVIPPVGALVADSTGSGNDRGKWITRRFVAKKYGQAAGPALALALFMWRGNKWTVRDCAVVIGAGQIVSFAAALILCFIGGGRSGREGSEAGSYGCRCGVRGRLRRIRMQVSQLLFKKGDIHGNIVEEDVRQVGAPREEDNSYSNYEARNRFEQSHYGGDEKLTPLLLENTEHFTDNPSRENYDDENGSNAGTPELRTGTSPKSRRVAKLIAISDLSVAISDGMIVRFFPIFFKDQMDFHPSQLFPLYIASHLLQAQAGTALRRLGRRWGRIETSLAGKWLSAAALFVVALSRVLRLPSFAVVVVYVIHQCAMNAPGPLTKGVLMDHVPEDERARWTALESLNRFSWSGSAIVGGLLVRRWGLFWNFGVTSCLQFLAAIPLVFLFGLEHPHNN